MSCLDCVSHGVLRPYESKRFNRCLDRIGLHCVFEHREAMTSVCLNVFLCEDRITIPVGVDSHHGRWCLPITVGRYKLWGFPSGKLLS